MFKHINQFTKILNNQKWREVPVNSYSENGIYKGDGFLDLSFYREELDNYELHHLAGFDVIFILKESKSCR